MTVLTIGNPVLNTMVQKVRTQKSDTVSLSITFYGMHMMYNSVCITSPSFFLLAPVVQEKMVRTHKEGKNFLS